MKTPIVTICAGGVVTGGPEAQHQFIDMVNRISPGTGFICYSPFEQSFELPGPYARYDAPSIRREDIPENAFIVIPEIWPHLIEEFRQPCALWWLSVDSFWSWSGNTVAMRKAAVQLTQSEYARRHVAEIHGFESLMLTDYINLDFGSNVKSAKRPRVAVNPSKGKHLIDEFRLKYPDIEIIELAGMSREQVQRELAESAIYIDFGHHPGRDRLPREAALCHVVLLTTRLGSAGNEVDVPIDEWYKFDTVEEAGEKARAILEDVSAHAAAQMSYFETIRGQHDAFEDEVRQLMNFADSYAAERRADEYLSQNFERPWYAHCVYYAAEQARKLGYEAISVLEFGVARGDGLMLLERYAAEVSKLLSMEIQVYGFDRGKGLPRPRDYRDQPFQWREGDFEMDEAALRNRLGSANLIVGEIANTLEKFFAEHQPAPVGATFFDLKLYSSTKDALCIFQVDERFRTPRIYCYFDGVFGNINSFASDYTGERLAISEFNESDGRKKISPAYYLHYSSMNGRDNIFVEHDFAHSKYDANIADPSP